MLPDAEVKKASYKTAQNKPSLGRATREVHYDRLMALAKQAESLAKRLVDIGGAPFTADEERLIRMAYMPALQDMFTAITTRFLFGERRSDLLETIGEDFPEI